MRGLGEGASPSLDRLVGHLTETLLHASEVISVLIIAVKEVFHIVVVPPALAHASICIVRFRHVVGRGVSRLAFHLRGLDKKLLSIGGICTNTVVLIGSTSAASTVLKNKMLSSRMLPAMMGLVYFLTGRAWINRLDVDVQG